MVDIVPRAVRHIVAEAVAALPRSTPMMAVEYSKRDGTTFWANAAGRAIRVGGRPARLVLVTDITEHRRTAEVLLRTEDQVRQAQKMEALGRLAGGVAHDFNNLLSVILGYSDMLLKDVGAESPMRDDLDEVRKAAQRGADLRRQLLLFSRHRAVEPTVLDPNELLRDMEGMLRRVLGASVALDVITTRPVGRVRADRGYIEQVVMNLVINARDAMPSGGKLTLETSDVVLGEEYAREHHGVVPGRYVLLAVTDTGVGMDKETLAHVFEPFFTTKERGKGTGLGLATVFGIAQQSGGASASTASPGSGRP